jgi:hypothetical protein
MCPKRGTRSNKVFKKLERRDFVPNPSFLISPSRLWRLWIFVSGHQSTTHGITSLDRCSDPKKPCAPDDYRCEKLISKKLERRDFSSLIPSFLISPSRLLRLGKNFSGHPMYLGVFRHPPSILFDLKHGHTPRQKCQSLPPIWS